MDGQMNGSQDPDFEKHWLEQISEIKSDFNHHVTKEKLGRDPTDSELAENYISTGGAKRLAIKNGRNTEGADL